MLDEQRADLPLEEVLLLAQQRSRESRCWLLGHRRGARADSGQEQHRDESDLASARHGLDRFQQAGWDTTV